MTPAAGADDYLEFLKKTGIPDYRNTKGNLGANVLRRIVDDKAHFLTLSFWGESIDAVKSFAGED
jgi:heme-degrading monooxygenase HmoA